MFLVSHYIIPINKANKIIITGRYYLSCHVQYQDPELWLYLLFERMLNQKALPIRLARKQCDLNFIKTLHKKHHFMLLFMSNLFAHYCLQLCWIPKPMFLYTVPFYNKSTPFFLGNFNTIVKNKMSSFGTNFLFFNSTITQLQ